MFAGITATAPPDRKFVAATADRLLLNTSLICGRSGGDAGSVSDASNSALPALRGSADTSRGDAAAKSCGRLIATDTPEAVPLTGS